MCVYVKYGDKFIVHADIMILFDDFDVLRCTNTMHLAVVVSVLSFVFKVNVILWTLSLTCLNISDWISLDTFFPFFFFIFTIYICKTIRLWNYFGSIKINQIKLNLGQNVRFFWCVYSSLEESKSNQIESHM